MGPSLSSLPTLECVSCQLGKHSHSSFPIRVGKHVSSLFSIIHFGVWGPSCVSSKQYFHCFITFVVDFSHTTWLYLMTHHSKLYYVFIVFCAEFKLNLMCLFELFIVIMLLNICHHPLNLIWHQNGFFIKPIVLAPHIKMELLDEIIVI